MTRRRGREGLPALALENAEALRGPVETVPLKHSNARP